MTAKGNYYNEFDPKSAAWLRALIKANLIPDGTVDERDIKEVKPEDLQGYTQCHFFAGIGGWSLALQLAGWPADRPVWTGSCPCQPFSTAGKGLGDKDPRHLWPVFYDLIRQCRPAVIFGEQVASSAGFTWLTGVRANLEDSNYAVGAADLPAACIGQKNHPIIQEARNWAYEMADSLDLCGRTEDAEQFRDFANYLGGIIVGPPHLRQRLWWMAYSLSNGRRSRRRNNRKHDWHQPATGGGNVGLALSSSGRLKECGLSQGWRTEGEGASDESGAGGRLADSESDRRQWGSTTAKTEKRSRQKSGAPGELPLRPQGSAISDSRLGDSEPDRCKRWPTQERSPVSTASEATRAGCLSGSWSDFYLVPCRDGKARRVGTGVRVLADGLPGRPPLLRGYGNAIIPEVGAVWIEVCKEAIGQEGEQVKSPTIQFINDRLSVHFNQFGQSAYELFLKCKRLPEFDLQFHPEGETYTITAPARFADMLGATAPKIDAKPLKYCKAMYDDQIELVVTALEAKRFAIWSGCGNGKTLIGLEFARQVVHRTKGKFLIVTMNDIVQEWIDQADHFYGIKYPLVRLETRADMREWMKDGANGTIAITNYEKWNPGSLEDQVINEARYLAGIALDESSRLKGGGGKQKWALIKSCRGIEYKLSLTATPAPNDTIEFASQASFLEKMRTDVDIIWTYFTRDPKTLKWTVKPHAREAFFQFMSSWSIYVNDPKRYGWRKNLPDVPTPVYKIVEIEPTPEQREWQQKITVDKVGQSSLFGNDQLSAIQRVKLSQVAKGFRYLKGKSGRSVQRIPSDKPVVTAGIIRDEVAAGAQVLVWTVFDAESQMLSEILDGFSDGFLKVNDVEVLTGSTNDDERINILDRFRHGQTRVLISRARMLGYGQNFQFVKAMVFSGWSDSFEDLYQAIRRAVRHGQQDPVRVYFPVIRELEGETLANVQRKEADFERSIREMEENYIKARSGK